MTDESKPPKDAKKKGGSRKLTREEYNRLVKGVDDIYFGGLDEPEDEKKPLPEKPAVEPPKHEDDKE